MFKLKLEGKKAEINPHLLEQRHDMCYFLTVIVEQREDGQRQEAINPLHTQITLWASHVRAQRIKGTHVWRSAACNLHSRLKYVEVIV